MGKKGGSKRGRSKDSSSTSPWNAADHAERKTKIQKQSLGEKQEIRERRTALLTRDSKEKHDASKLRLHIIKVKREIENLRERLTTWDDVEEKRIEEENKRREQEAQEATTEKKGRKGPETWKLRGPARPAWEVYDFDTRYVDPHIKAHEEAKIKAQRSRNIFLLYKGRFSDEVDNGGPPQPHCRQFLALLMQSGLLNFQAKKFKDARTAFLECMDLDSQDHPITPARCHLMRLYLEANRPESARRLWERLPEDDPSVWIRYSAALVEYVSWKVLNEEGSTRETAELHLARAIRSNVFCAYYLAFHEKFADVMDYTEDIEGANEDNPLEEAIEYCCSEQMGAWFGTEGAVDWVRDVVLRAIHGFPVSSCDLSPSDLEWRSKLAQIEEDYESQYPTILKTKATKKKPVDSDIKNNTDCNIIDDDDSINMTKKNKNIHVSKEAETGDDHDEEQPTDVLMFTVMFRTAMEMLEDAGDLRRQAT